MFGTRVLAMYHALRAPRVPRGVTVMHPYRDGRTMRYVAAFLAKYFSDDRPRVLVFGINPGRHGAGLTGITFTDPVRLKTFCAIPNDFGTHPELSSAFIYDHMMVRYGGPASFYQRFFLTAVSPLGYTVRNKNFNYYDNAGLQQAVTPFITRAIRKHLEIGGRRDHAVVLGQDKNAKFVKALNDEHGFFGQIHVLKHPRPIMQYERKRVDAHVDAYLETFARIPADEESS